MSHFVSTLGRVRVSLAARNDDARLQPAATGAQGEMTSRFGVGAGRALEARPALRRQNTPDQKCALDPGATWAADLKLDPRGKDVQGPGGSTWGRFCGSPGWSDCWNLHSAPGHTHKWEKELNAADSRYPKTDFDKVSCS